MIEFLVFALIFWVQSDSCIEGKNGKFSHALWMSSRTASTLGFNQISPNPECTFTNLMVMCQVIASSLVNFIMLGLVFARFSAPSKRASTIRFSSVMVCYQQPSSGYWCLSLRVANIRKHQLLKPTLRLVLTAVDSITPSNYLFENLAIDAHSMQETNLELGFPANVTHIITPSSPLYNLSVLEMDTRMMEHQEHPPVDPPSASSTSSPAFSRLNDLPAHDDAWRHMTTEKVLVFVDGIDAMTSKNMSARHAYGTNEVHVNEMFQPLHLEMRGGSLGLDFSGFDLTMLASVELLNEHNSEPGLAERPLPEVQSHMWHLRHMTFKRLTEKDHANRQPASESPAAGSGPSATGSRGQTVAYRPPSRVDGAASSAAAAGAGGGGVPGGASANPFSSHGSGGGGGSGAMAASGGGTVASSWMGFGMPLQPGAAGIAAAPAAPSQSLAGPGGQQQQQQQPAPMPLSAFINSGQSGLESFADMTLPVQHPHPHRGSPQQQQQQQQAASDMQSLVSPSPRGSWGAVGQPLPQQHPVYPGPGSGAGGGNGLEMLPTSLPAMEPRSNGIGGGAAAGGR
ncbi:hypothetical protein VOLCADRAFT_98369 [Volvox carteri f. nagariensis]|uniref:Inward rectifier potassium channel C-terminal domain-containing protein n=1 Tax=Volvox carteri f. nagariensis TaxID=3068 RepID=D8UF60_VOLCA|nr:uncharacterized protein VOLCADRAFT_98369 [Volvox carteri f. nagariensis]EFJ41660.1 hypothetical protein VOLCADRAFT_98369 [Volvox carteri f. nagariensis]|eukprot:XP_002957316.1 hypothetical protein VOLCADRAFT_98369 [Volvox carteri f. nagariensis]